MAQNRHWEQDKDATIYMGNIDERATPAMMYEIMLQMGPIHNIHMPRDRVTQSHQGFGFVEFRTPTDAEYAAAVMNGVKLYGKSLRVNKASADRARGGPGGGGTTDIGAELFVGNLDPAADERVLYDTFSRFGPLLTLPKVARDDAGVSKGFGFVSFGDFESADAAIENLAGQYLLSNQVTVQFAFKKDGKGERHGDEAERELAAQARKRNVLPEAQPLPPGFLNPSPAAAAAVSAAPPMQQPGSTGPPASATPHLPAGFAPPPGMPPGMHMAAPPPGFAPPRGPSPYNAAPGQTAPPPSSVGGRAGAPLPAAPSGLPARPPQSQGSYNNPADYHPNGSSYRSGSGGGPAPPPGFPGAPQQQPPPGFGVPGSGAPGAPPPGFMPPPPGFSQQPPPSYPRR